MPISTYEYSGLVCIHIVIPHYASQEQLGTVAY